MKIAIFHDYFDKKGGGEKLIINLARALKADVYTGFINKEKTFDTNGISIISLGVKESQPKPLRGLAIAKAFEKYDFPKYDAYIFSGVWCISAVRENSILYCHTPPRYMYDLKDYFMKKSVVNKITLYYIIKKWKPKDQEYMKKFRKIAANSKNVKKRIEKFYGQETAKKCVVVYTGIESKKYFYKRDGLFYLSSQRLDELKRIDLIINAFKEMPEKNLTIVSTGSEENKLKQLAKGCDNILFTGSVSDEELINLYANCRAVVVAAKDEDLGLAAIEAHASGKPAIVVAEGGLLETVNNANGVFFQPNIDSLKKAVNVAETKKWNRKKIQNSARKYDIFVFSKKIKKLLKSSK